jgi:acyl-CoA synthetase (AMP-forming)/AMP-acid ligase II|tara:strand:- start:2238 stop:3794 length:1557 start_codon:yes stop_codon:yes gene_type:complete
MDVELKGSLVETFRWRCQNTPDSTAIKFLDREQTYSQFNTHSNQVAQGLLDFGLTKDTRISYLAKNTDYFFEILVGALKTGTITVGVNWRLAADEVAYVLEDSQSEVIFVSSEFFDVMDIVKDKVSTLKKIICIDERHLDWPLYSEWRDSQENIDPLIDSQPDDDVVQLYTSGTTGHPKGVQLTNRNFTSATESTLQVVPITHQSPCMVCMPVYHVAGTNFGIWGLLQGCKNIVIPEVDPGLILELVEKEKIELTMWVPAVILFLLQHPNSSNTDFSSLKMVLYGASPIAEDTLLKAIDLMDCDFYQVYGLTETTGAITVLSPEDHDVKKGKLRSCGKAIPGVDIKVVTKDGDDLPHGEVGEIITKSNLNMKGYWNNAKATNETFKDGWFYSGDLGYFDEDEFLYIHDRLKDMIVSGGENIYPAEVENALMSNPDILDAAVVGIPDNKWGEATKAFVVLRSNNILSEDEIINYVKTKIASYKCPKSVDFIDALPRNPSGKVLRRELRDPYWADQDREV